jgi:CRAL/TRIO domain
MEQLAIVNAPSFIWSIIRPWLSKETAEKVDILENDYKDQLLKLIDADCLPSTLGGTCECKEEGGCQLSGAGPWLDGRVGWGPNASKKRKRPLNRLDNEGAINASTSKVEGRNDLRGVVNGAGRANEKRF